MDADPDVTAYLDRLPEPDRSTLEAWRALCRTLPDGFDEQLRYGMPCYVRDDEPEIGFARQKRYLSLYVVRTDVMAAHRGRLDGYSMGKGCVRFPLGRPTDLDLVAAIVTATGATLRPRLLTPVPAGVTAAPGRAAVRPVRRIGPSTTTPP